WISHEGVSGNSLGLARLRMPPNPLSAHSLINLPGRSAGSGDLTFRLHAGLSPYTDPYGTCGGVADSTGYCGLYHPDGHMDSLTALAGERPVYGFSTRYVANDELPTATMRFQTDRSPSANNVVLQVYRFG